MIAAPIKCIPSKQSFDVAAGLSKEAILLSSKMSAKVSAARDEGSTGKRRQTGRFVPNSTLPMKVHYHYYIPGI